MNFFGLFKTDCKKKIKRSLINWFVSLRSFFGESSPSKQTIKNFEKGKCCESPNLYSFIFSERFFSFIGDYLRSPQKDTLGKNVLE